MRKFLVLVLVMLFVCVGSIEARYKWGVQLTETSAVLTPNASGYVLTIASDSIAAIPARANRIVFKIQNTDTTSVYAVVGNYHVTSTATVYANGWEVQSSTSAATAVTPYLNWLDLPGFTGKVSMTKGPGIADTTVRVLEMWK